IFFFCLRPEPPSSTLFPYTTLFRSRTHASAAIDVSDGLAGDLAKLCRVSGVAARVEVDRVPFSEAAQAVLAADAAMLERALSGRSEEHTSELQSRENLVCRLLLEKK